MEVGTKRRSVVLLVLGDHTGSVDAITFDCELEVEDRRVKVGILMPPPFYQGLLECAVLLADEDLRLRVKTKSSTVHYPLGAVLNLFSLVLGGKVVHIFLDQVLFFLGRGADRLDRLEQLLVRLLFDSRLQLFRRQAYFLHRRLQIQVSDFV